MKTQLRLTLLEQLKSKSSQELDQISTQVCERFLQHSQIESFAPGLKIALYRHLSTELRLSVLENILLKAGAFLHYPRMSLGQNNEHLEMVSMQGGSSLTAAGWVKSTFGVLEPSPHLPPIPASDLDLLIIPVVAVGLDSGVRLGRGRGYYDRFLENLEDRVLRVALIFDEQFIKEDQMPKESHDCGLHWVLSEKREFKNKDILERWLNRYKGRVS